MSGKSTQKPVLSLEQETAIFADLGEKASVMIERSGKSVGDFARDHAISISALTAIVKGKNPRLTGYLQQNEKRAVVQVGPRSQAKWQFFIIKVAKVCKINPQPILEKLGLPFDEKKYERYPDNQYETPALLDADSITFLSDLIKLVGRPIPSDLAMQLVNLRKNK